jgi:hypothetical protein
VIDSHILCEKSRLNPGEIQEDEEKEEEQSYL